MQPDERKSDKSGFFSQAYGMVTGILTRILVHACALISGIVIGVKFVPPEFSGHGLMLGVLSYVGLICLLPRGIDCRRPAWIIPSLTGWLLCLLWGMTPVCPFVPTLVVGGALTWALRLIISKGRMGWEWSVLPALIFSLGVWVQDFLPLLGSLSLLWAFPILLVLGWGAYTLLAGYEARNKAHGCGSKDSSVMSATKSSVFLSPEQEAHLHDYELSAEQLIQKKKLLPLEVQRQVENIHSSTRNILRCMREDAQDTQPGDRFLHRYLKAVHTVLDEYMRLAGQGAQNMELAYALRRAQELLGRLEQAFQQEHANLLKNDTVDLMAELNVLDKLLDMDGK